MPNSKYIIAAAGSGKTTYLVNEALEKKPGEQVLITTFTIENEKEIRRKFIKKNKAIPSNVTILTWWSFLLRHGVKPYQAAMTERDIKGIHLVSSTSAVKYFNKRNRFPVCYREDEIDKHYFNADYKLYSDKIAKFVIKNGTVTNNAAFTRIAQIFDHIYIDETQDLVGYDLEIIKELIERIPVTLVGDPRQVTFQTHHSTKNRKYSHGNVDDFIYDKLKKKCKLEPDLLNGSHRCNQPICDFSNSLFPGFPAVTSKNNVTTDHDGIFWVHPDQVEAYLEKYSPIQLRDSRSTKVSPSAEALNFGVAKGLTFERALVYPTEPMKKFLLGKAKLKDKSLCRLYVASTRAKYSTAFVWDAELPKGCTLFDCK